MIPIHRKRGGNVAHSHSPALTTPPYITKTRRQEAKGQISRERIKTRGGKAFLLILVSVFSVAISFASHLILESTSLTADFQHTKTSLESSSVRRVLTSWTTDIDTDNPQSDIVPVFYNVYAKGREDCPIQLSTVVESFVSISMAGSGVLVSNLPAMFLDKKSGLLFNQVFAHLLGMLICVRYILFILILKVKVNVLVCVV